MADLMSWLEATERLGIGGALVFLIFLFGWKYLAPLFVKQGELVDKLSIAIDRQETTNEQQTVLLSKIVEEEQYEKSLLKDIKDGVDELKQR